MIDLRLGNCLDVMKTMESNSVDAIVTDPPYGLSFMGKKWDYDVPSQEIWEEALRVLKPGGYLLAFAGTRTQHRMACRIEDAGFEIRDMIAWVYGSGFPKSLNIGKAVDKIQCNAREVIGTKKAGMGTGKSFGMLQSEGTNGDISTPKSVILDKGTSEWEGWGTALKPALEPITVARKPIEGTVAQNCLKWGVGGINIDGCRVESNESIQVNIDYKDDKQSDGWGTNKCETELQNKGRFPANLIHDGSDEVVELFPNTKSSKRSSKNNKETTFTNTYTPPTAIYTEDNTYGDSGSAARFFYCAKASKSERNMGCDELEEQIVNDGRETDIDNAYQRGTTLRKNTHPTVKPIALMEYLIKLVSKENQVILDPFMGSGSTGVACKKLDRNFIGIELDKDYLEIANKRIDSVESNNQLTIYDI